MNPVPDLIKRALICMDRFQGTLEKYNILTSQDKARLCQATYARQILFGQSGNALVHAMICQPQPLLVSRLGSVELACLNFFLQKRLSGTRPYRRRIRVQMSTNAGFFPVDDRSLDAFCELYLQAIAQVDLLGVWFNRYENVICNRHCPAARLVHFDCLEPFRFSDPWSSALAGRRVLVVHPFAASIAKQYAEKRRALFADPAVLPEFELRTLATVQSIGGAAVEYASWFDALKHMREQIAAVDFDICIIGAGAYGLPLAAFVKQLGKQALHLGGVTQILFGIKGRRWEELYADSTAKLFNEHWVRPLPAETPANKNSIENGCYW